MPIHLLSSFCASREGFEITDTPFSAVLLGNTRHKNASCMAFRHNFLELCVSSGMVREGDEHMIQCCDKELKGVVLEKEEEMEKDR